MGWKNNKMTKPIEMGNIRDAVAYGSLDLGTLIANGNIKPMAKYKPVRRPEIGILNETQRAETRYGFGTISDKSLPKLPMSTAEPQNDWVYLRPQGIGDNEWYRMLDFDGYVSNACHPLVIKAEQISYDGLSVVMLYGDSMTNGQRSDGKSWVANESLSLDELLLSGEDYTGYNIAFILCSGGKKNLIVTNVTARKFIHDKNNVNGFYFYPSLYEEGGVKYPAVPLLASTKSGDKVTVIVCLTGASLAPTSTEYAYNIYSDESLINSYTLYSLGFVAGCDRVSKAVTTSAFKLDGVDFTLSISKSNKITESYVGNLYWGAYQITVMGTFNNPVGWGPADLTKTLSGTLTINGAFGVSPSEFTSISTSTSVDLYPDRSGQQRTLYTTGSDKYLWVVLTGPGGTPQPISITAEVTMATPLTNPITRTARLTL